jgi:hypothetical protein
MMKRIALVIGVAALFLVSCKTGSDLVLPQGSG